jgi:hypothetical protein
MPFQYKPPVFALRVVETALSVVTREEHRLIAIIDSERSSPDERFAALANLADLARELVIKLAGCQ